MRKEVHTPRMVVGLAAFLMALALPVAAPLSMGEDETAVAVVQLNPAAIPGRPVPFAGGVPTLSVEVLNAASMMLVGSVLIGIGSMVRRVS